MSTANMSTSSPFTTTTPKPQTQIKIRRANFTDLWPSARLLASAFTDDPLFGPIIHPHRTKYPNDMPLYFYRDWLTEYFDPDMVFLVATDNDTIIGVAQWHRIRDNDTAPKKNGSPWWNQSWNWIRDKSLKLYISLTSLIHPNRAACPINHDILHRADPWTAHLWTPPARRNRWFLHFLGVSASHRHLGIGRNLAGWGIEKAKEEGVGAVVVAAAGKDEFYVRCGFNREIGQACAGVGNPLGGVPGGSVLWMEPGDRGEKKGEGEKKGGESVVVVVEVPEVDEI